jgi:hypothetical protein
MIKSFSKSGSAKTGAKLIAFFISKISFSVSTFQEKDQYCFNILCIGFTILSKSGMNLLINLILPMNDWISFLEDGT